MTIIEADEWTGLPINSVRPFARVRMGQQLLQVAKDQAFGFRALTGNSVPNAPGVDVATPHAHDGANGLVRPLPLIQCYVGADLPSGTVATAAFARFHWPIFWVPPGVTRAKVFVWTPSVGAVFLQQGIKATTYSLDLTPYATGETFVDDASLSMGGLHCLVAGIDLEPGAVNAVLIEVMDGIGLQPRRIEHYSIIMDVGAPSPVAPHQTPIAHSDEVLVPSASHHLGSDPFTSFDSAMFDDDRAVSSYVAYSMTMNEAYCFERATDVPAGTRSARTHRGHRHHTGEDDPGVDIPHSLGAWSFGVLRKPPGGGLYIDEDQLDPAENEWSGRIHAPTIITSTTAQLVAAPLIRLPGKSSASYNGATSKLNVAMLVFNDNGKTTGMQGQAQLADVTGVTLGTSKTLGPTTTSGWQILTGSAVDRSGAGGDDDIQMLKLSLRQAAAVDQGAAIYSACAWYEP